MLPAHLGSDLAKRLLEAVEAELRQAHYLECGGGVRKAFSDFFQASKAQRRH